MANVEQVVPFFGVSNMDHSLRFYIEGLGFEMKHRWIPEGRIRWCWLELGGAALMLQEFNPPREGPLGRGVSLNFICQDALAIYHQLKSRGIDVSRPFVGNNMWVTSLADPDGYQLHFESPTDVPEDTVYPEAE